jgi:hypothetical protein
VRCLGVSFHVSPTRALLKHCADTAPAAPPSVPGQRGTRLPFGTCGICRPLTIASALSRWREEAAKG